MRDLALPRRAYRRARRRLAHRALSVALLLGLVVAPFWSAGPPPAEAQAPLPAPTAARPLGAAQDATPAATPAASPTPGARPPANDPAGPPSAYTLSRSDQLFVAKTQQWPSEQGVSASASTYTLKPDLSGLAGSTPYADTGMPASDPSWPLLPVRGRFTDPLHEQAQLLSQSSDCAAAGSCTYTLLLGSPAGQGTAVTPWLWQVQGEPGGSPAAVAAGDLDGRISAQGLSNDEAVVAYRWADGTLRVEVIDYNTAPGEAVATAPTVALPGIGTAAAGPGSLAVAVGDFDSDGQNEIAVLWQGGCYFVAAPACLSAPHLSMLRYSNTGRAQTLAVLRADVPLPSAVVTGSPARNMGFQTAVDDFDGQGVDLLAFSFIEQDPRLVVLGFARGDEQFTVSRYGRDPGDWWKAAYCPQNTCWPQLTGAAPQLAAGLFWYDEASGHGLGRRQLALMGLTEFNNSSASQVGAQVYDVAFDSSTCTSSLPCPLTLTGLFQVQDSAGTMAAQPVQLTGTSGGQYCCVPPAFSLAAGSFQGLVMNPTDPSQVPWALAVGITFGQATNAPAITYYKLTGNQPSTFALSTLFQTDLAAAGSANEAETFRLLAYDPAGDSLVMGAPLVFTMTGHYIPNFILQDPPKHLDWFYDPQQKHGSWLQVDRSTSLNLTVSDTQGSTYQSQNDTTTSWTIGASVTVNATASAEVGIDGVDDAKSGLDASASVGGQYDHNSDSYTGSSSSDTLTTSGSTFDDDLMAGTTRTWSVYRYPILGRPLKDKSGAPVLAPDGQPQYGYYEITLPGATVPFGPGGGIDHQDWYQPLHQNGIALSYPALSSTTGLVAIDPTTLGPAVPLIGSDDNGTKPMQYLQQPLVNKAYTVDATGSMVSLSVTTTTSGGDTTNATGTLSESADVDAGTSGKANFGIGAVSGCVDVDVKLNNSNSWGKLDTSSNTTTATNTFTIIQDSAAQPDWGYGAASAYYTDSAGVYRASHGVDILQGSTDSQANWKQYYGGRPDPALNLPARMMVTYSQVDKANDIPKFSNSDSRQRIRGFFVLNPDAAHGGPSGSLAAGTTAANPVDGDTLQLQVRVHNYSLDTAATGVPVEFWAVARDVNDEKNVGAPTKLGTVTLDTIPALGWVPANFLWDTSGKAPKGNQLYRIFVIVARNNPDLGSADPWNNVIHAWADRYDDPATVDGTKPGCGNSNCDRLTDPFTGLYETLEAGQNKQGWGEVTISPKSSAPAPLAAAASRTATELRFGSGGVSVTAPRTALGAAAAPRAAAVTTDSVHEVRAHVAAAATALGNSMCHDNGNAATLQVYDGVPGQGGRLVGAKRVTGLAGSGPAGRWVTIPWTPREAGRRQLVLRLTGASMDPKATPVDTTVEVDVAPAPEPPATLGRLQDVLRVVWLPANLRAALLAQVQAANTAALAGDQPAARAALTALKAQTEAARGTAISGYSASRVGGVVDALLVQPAIAAVCLPASAAPVGTPGPGAAAPAGALPACAPGTVTGTVTPSATGTPGTATATPAGTPATASATATPVASGTPGTPAAGRTGTPTPTTAPASGSPTPGAGSPTPVRTATPAAPPTVVPPPHAPPTVVPPPHAPPTVVPPPLPPPTVVPPAPR